MTGHADELKQLNDRYRGVQEKLTQITQKLDQFGSPNWVSSISQALERRDIKQVIYFNHEQLQSYINLNIELLDLSKTIQDLQARIVDIGILDRRLEQSIQALQLLLSKEEEETKKLQEMQDNSKAHLEKINNAFFSLIPENFKTSPQLLELKNTHPFDWAIVCVTDQLKFRNIDSSKVQALLKTKISDDENGALLGDYVEFKSESQGAFSRSRHSVVFTEKGKQLKEYVSSHDERLQLVESAKELAIRDLEALISASEINLKQMDADVQECQYAFDQVRTVCIDHFSKSKELALGLRDKQIKEINGHIIEIKKLQKISIPQIIALTGQESIESLEAEEKKLQESIEQIEKNQELQQAYFFTTRKMLNEAIAIRQEYQNQYGVAPIWTRLLEIMTKKNNKIERLSAVEQTQKTSLVALREHSVVLNQQIRLKKQTAERLAAEAERERLAAEEKFEASMMAENDLREQRDSVESKHEVSTASNNLIARYRSATQNYLTDLGDDIKTRVESLEESYREKQKKANSSELEAHPYKALLTACHLQENDKGLLPKTLKELFDVDKDRNEVALATRTKIKNILREPKNQPIAAALDKYGLVSKLSQSLESGTEGFLNLLKNRENQTILFKHRDAGALARLQAFFKACGPAVMNIFQDGFKKIYYGGTFFPSAGKRYAIDIDKISELEMAGPDPKRRKLSVS